MQSALVPLQLKRQDITSRMRRSISRQHRPSDEPASMAALHIAASWVDRPGRPWKFGRASVVFSPDFDFWDPLPRGPQPRTPQSRIPAGLGDSQMVSYHLDDEMVDRDSMA
ncbi:hypothetical protein CPLU01_07839 [Colletotrichum plurivorum]|uniref:Uncharacterized protein n=1 Tax=Colletotrichum plurivorum TaxID=2175906 RepID=A0A8H6KEL5_9PEZI|nr:hypothetical protein CPLU01_07839 [Colletotrichum plurivorum]